MEIKESLKKIIGTKRLPALVCKVDTVDTNNLTCDLTPADDSAPIKGALLTPLAGSGALVAVPQPGSWALAVMLSDNKAVVVMVLPLTFAEMLRRSLPDRIIRDPR